jgi:hypothetical protein
MAMVVLAIACAPAVHAAANVKLIAKATGKGSHPIAALMGVAKAKTPIFLQVKASRAQKVTVYWQLLCDNVPGVPNTANEQGSSRAQHGKLIAVAPFTKLVARISPGPPPCATTIDVYGSKAGTLNAQTFQK